MWTNEVIEKFAQIESKFGITPDVDIDEYFEEGIKTTHHNICLA